MLDIVQISSERIYPETRTYSVKTIPLSIIDAHVQTFAPCEAVWYFNPTPDLTCKPSPSPIHLKNALRKTLNAYPQWTGLLHPSNFDPRSVDHTKHLGRLCITWGLDSDPGIEFVEARANISLSSLIPTAGERRSKFQNWDASSTPSAQLRPKTALALKEEDQSLPGVIIQVTSFSCGGFAVTIRFVHPLADAHTLAYFAKDWASVSRAMLSGDTIPDLSPIFSPQLVDNAAAGDIDAAESDPELIRVARKLPLHRYDWWFSPGCPWPTNATDIPPQLDSSSICPEGQPIPWSELDLSSPTAHYVLHFTGPEMRRIWEGATALDPALGVSKQDALLSHLWTCINRARGLDKDSGQVHMSISLSLRPRLFPPLPHNSLGSPLIMIAASTKVSQLTPSAHGQTASLIRRSLSQFTPETLAAFLHDKAYELDPSRIWHGFLGRRHVMVTSWVHTGVYGVDFGGGEGRPRYVDGVMPGMDGLACLMEAPPPLIGTEEEARRGHWSDGGIDVHLYLKTETMERLLGDPLLRKYGVQ